MLYTSGTTGLPKGVPAHPRQRRRQRGRLVALQRALLHEDAVDSALAAHEPHLWLRRALPGQRPRLYQTHSLCPPDVLGAMPALRPTVFMSVPAYWEKLANQARLAEDPVADAAAPHRWSPALLPLGRRGPQARGQRAFLRDGRASSSRATVSPRCSPTLTLNRPNDYRLDSVGKALPSVELRIAEDAEIRPAGPTFSLATTKTRRPPPKRLPRTVGSTPATSAPSTTMAFCRSSAARKRSWSLQVARTFRRPTSRCSSRMTLSWNMWWSTAMAKNTWWPAIWPNRSNIETIWVRMCSAEAIRQLLGTRVSEVNAQPGALRDHQELRGHGHPSECRERALHRLAQNSSQQDLRASPRLHSKTSTPVRRATRMSRLRNL